MRSHVLACLVLILMLGACGPQPPPATAVPPVSPTAQPAPTEKSPPAPTPMPPTATQAPPTDTPVPPTVTSVPPSATPKPPTETPEPPTPTSEPPTPTPSQPVAMPKQTINLRNGPGTAYAVIGSAKAGQTLEIVGKSADGTWWQVCCIGDKQAWLSAGLVTVQGETAGMPVPSNIPTPPPKPTSPPASRLPVKQAILSPDDYADILPTTMCIMNALKEDEFFSGYMCFVAAEPIGASEVTMMLYTLRACPGGGACATENPGDGKKVPLPAAPPLPPDASLVEIANGGYRLTATANGYVLVVSLSKGDPQLVSQKLTAVAARQFEKVR